MAVEVVLRIIDDIDLVPIPDEEATHVEFAFGGKQYEMHLNPANLEKFNDLLSYYAERAREVKPEKGKPKPKNKAPAAKPKAPELEPLPPQPPGKHHRRPGIRAWARDHGYGEIKGRATNELMAAYDAAHARL